MERANVERYTEYEKYEYDRFGSRAVNPLNRCICKMKFIFTFAWCQCSPIAWLNVRHLQIILISLMMSVVAMTSNIRIIVLMMTDVYLTEGFDWDRRQQVIAHTIFFYGNIFTNLCNHLVGKYLDKKSIVCGSLFLACFVNVMTPFLIRRGNWMALLLSRFFIGMIIGLLSELLNIIICRWSTQRDKMRMFCMALSGVNLGHAIMLAVVCSLYDSRFPMGQDFYFMATYGSLIMVIWMLLGARDPQYCPYLSDGERMYLQENSIVTDELDISFFKIPWKMIFTNVPFHALMAAEFCYRMAFWINIAHMPLFFAQVYGYPFWKAGMMSALPHLIVWLSCYPVSQMVGLFIRARIVHVTAVRKWCDLLALCVGALSFFALVGSKSLLGSVTSYTAVVTLEMYHLMGGGINHIDLSPRYSGVLLGISRGFSNFAAIFSAVLVMWLVPDLHEQDDWNPLFIVTGSVSMMGGIIFFVFGSAETQAFNYYPP